MGLSKDTILRQIPLFAGLAEQELELVEEKSGFVDRKKGDIIYAEGAPADAFYCVVLGRVAIYTHGPDGGDRMLEYLHRGKYFGIISILTGEPHSVTAKAINDCLLLVINKEDFTSILNKIPRIAIDLSQTLSRRLKRKDIHQKVIFESTVISVFSSYSQAGKSIYALNLSLSFAQETHKSVVVLDIALAGKIHSLAAKLEIEGEYPILDLSGPAMGNPSEVKDFVLKSKFGISLICASYNPEDASCVKKMVNILSSLVNDYHYIIMDLPSYMDPNIFQILNQSDLIHILTSPEPVDLQKTRNLIERLQTEFNFQEAKIKVIINEYKLAKLPHEEQAGILNRGIFATLPRIEFGAPDRLVLEEPTGEYSRAIRRIARQLGDCLVGLALGVGVGYGFCHIGVLKVIEEEKIPIDVICGSSIGAIIAGLWATGRSSAEILEITKEFKEPKHIWNMIDLTFPATGFIKGNKLYNFLKRHFNKKTFHDVRLPLKVIASDIRRKEYKILDKGTLVDAIMASCSMPGVFMPFKIREDMLLDGGIVSPLPCEPLLASGVKKIIAVNVTPSREDILLQYEKLKEKICIAPVKSAKAMRWFSLGQYLKDKFQVNILDLVFSSVEILQSEVAKQEAKLADVVLHPDTQGLYWLELHRAAEFAKRGEEEARRKLDRIWEVVNE